MASPKEFRLLSKDSLKTLGESPGMLAPVLQRLDFGSEAGELVSGLVPLSADPASTGRLDEQLALRDAASIGGIDYVFFRRFADSRSSQVVAYIVDNLANRLSEPQLADLHKRVWLHGAAPIIYVAWPTRVDILSCARGPDFWSDGKYRYSPADQIRELVQHAPKVDAFLKEARYSAWRLVDGTFWEDPRNATLAASGERAHERLIQAVVDTDLALGGETNPLLRRLLLLTVLIKYLEDRRVFPSGWFGRFCAGAKTFFDVLRNGDPTGTIRLLSNLERRFNGDIFTLPEAARNRLTKSALRHFAQLVEARTIDKQRYLWEQFSFEHIPVEIVSHLYQRFVKGGHGKVYTPPFLASLLLDYAMPYEKLTCTERILDPACGSGVFLVGAFRRLVNAWRGLHGWDSVDVAILKRILAKSIFGIELDPEAVDLTAFSLALAVCDVLKPEVIWSELKFDPLRGRNLLEGDFFAELKRSDCEKATICTEPFDVILGNPPFESELTECGTELNREAKRQRGTLPDKQAAYLFLEQGINQLTPNGRLCLIQPASILHNSKAYHFRTRLFTAAQVDAVLDFTSIRNLYEAADTKTVALLITHKTPRADHAIAHVTFRRTFGTHERIAFEVDHYDWHWVTQQTAIEDQFVWRLNLLGGGRLRDLSRRLRDSATLSDYAEQQGFAYGEGYIVGNQRYECDFLTGMQLLPAEALTDDGIDREQLTTVTPTHFEGPRDESLYQSPLILIRKNERLQLGFWDDGPIAFTSTVVAIGVGKGKESLLREMFARLKSRHRTYRLSCVLHGSKAFVAKATAILKQDIDALPFPDNESKLDLSFWEKIIEDDVLDYFCDYVRLGQNSDILKHTANVHHIADYAEVFCKMLGSVYGNLKADSPILLNGLICQPFYFGDVPGALPLSDGDSGALQTLIYHKYHESLRTVRMLRFYADNLMLIVKPDRLRFWIRSTAIRDADETIVSLRQQGY